MLRRIVLQALVFAAVAASAAVAQEGGKIPVTRDLERLRAIDRRLGIDDDGPGVDRNVERINPTGVPGFAPPPGSTYGDSVGNSGPLPPGAPGNDQ